VDFDSHTGGLVKGVFAGTTGGRPGFVGGVFAEGKFVGGEIAVIEG
jgi:hypothetical protein